MRTPLPFSALLLALAVLTSAASHAGHGAHLALIRRRAAPPAAAAAPAKRTVNRRRSCQATSASGSLAVSATSKPPAATTASTKNASGAAPTEAVAAGDFTPVKPSNWPTATQAGPKPTSTVASSKDPNLEELSKAIDNSGNSLFTSVHEGDMTYYGQGLGACGDVYDDSSFTAAVSHLMYDAWPGADTDAQNRNPICGPFVPGRQSLNSQGLFKTSVKSPAGTPGYVLLGGDGLLNCVGTADVQCHIPLTATVTHGDKSIQVKIVDRCANCKEGDIDLTPAAFAALADMGLGRTSVKWQFDAW